MVINAAKPAEVKEGLKSLIQSQSAMLAAQLQAHHLTTFPPNAQKGIRNLSPSEVAKLLGVTEGYLRQIAAEIPDLSNLSPGGRRSYSVESVHEIRKILDGGARGHRRYLPWRSKDEALQVVSVMNFKGGSGKTTTTAHLAQFLALRGYRVLAIDLDPQASLSALFGHQPELDVGPNETLYGAIRYDEHRRQIAEIVRSTYIPDLHLIPGNLELMEFEHDTPKALMRRAPGDTMFFARIGQALSEIQDAYDVVVVDCPPQLGFLTMSALTAATSDARRHVDEPISGDDWRSLRGNQQGWRVVELSLDEVSDHTLRTERRAAEPDGGIFTLHLWGPCPKSPDAQEHRDFGRWLNESDHF